MTEGIRRKSKQRQLVLEAVKHACCHLTAEEVFQIVRQKNPNISLGTVYRNLNLLAELGEIQKLSLGGECDHFDKTLLEHGHLICKNCGAIEDLPCTLSASIRSLLEEERKQGVDTVSLTVTGLCKQCGGGHTEY